MFQWYQQTETRFNKNNILINLKYRHINGGKKSSVCVRACVRACMHVCERACVRSCVSVRARSCVPLSKQRGKECGRGVRGRGVSGRVCVYNQTNVRPVKYLETQLNDITAISLAWERSVLQLFLIFVIIKLVCYSKQLKRGWLVKGVSYVSGGHVRWVSMLYFICEIANLHIKHIPNDTFKWLLQTIRSIQIQTISNKTKLNSSNAWTVCLSYSVHLEFVGCGDGVQVIDVALSGAAVVFGSVLLWRSCVVRKNSKVRCFVGTSWFPTIPCY